MRLFKKKITRFVVVDFLGVENLFDYPKDLPIPRKGDWFCMEDKKTEKYYSGVVKQVAHSWWGSVHEIRIQVTRD